MIVNSLYRTVPPNKQLSPAARTLHLPSLSTNTHWIPVSWIVARVVAANHLSQSEKTLL